MPAGQGPVGDGPSVGQDPGQHDVGTQAAGRPRWPTGWCSPHRSRGRSRHDRPRSPASRGGARPGYSRSRRPRRTARRRPSPSPAFQAPSRPAHRCAPARPPRPAVGRVAIGLPGLGGGWLRPGARSPTRGSARATPEDTPRASPRWTAYARSRSSRRPRSDTSALPKTSSKPPQFVRALTSPQTSSRSKPAKLKPRESRRTPHPRAMDSGRPPGC